MTEGLVNSYTDLSKSKASNLDYAALLDATVKLPHDKEFGVHFSVNTRTTTDKANSLYNLITQGVEPTTDFRNRYNHNKQQNLQLLGYIDYPLIKIEKSHGKISHNINTTYIIEHQNQQGNRNFYRLDRLGGDWSLPDRKPLGQLPSTADSLALATDWGNTNQTTTRQTIH